MTNSILDRGLTSGGLYRLAWFIPPAPAVRVKVLGYSSVLIPGVTAEITEGPLLDTEIVSQQPLTSNIVAVPALAATIANIPRTAASISVSPGLQGYFITLDEP